MKMNKTRKIDVTRKSMAGACIGVTLLGASAGARTYDLGDPYRRDGRLRENMTLVGTVTKNSSGNKFVIRARNSFTYRVWARWGQPLTLTVGDRVRVYGDWKDGMLHAGNVRVLRQGYDYEASRYGFPAREIVGTVTKNSAGNEFVVRARNGWTYPVVALSGEPANLTVGDRVRAYGDWRDGALQAGNIRLLYDGAVLRDAPEMTGLNTAEMGSRVMSNGVTNSIAGSVFADLPGNEFTLQAPNGYSYRVRALRGEPATMKIGDRVRVYGTWLNGVMQAANIRIGYRSDGAADALSTTALYDYDTPARADRILSGTVTSNPSGDRFTLRASNGYTYAVRALNGEPISLTAGDRVRVAGAWRDGLLHASNVRVLRQGRNPDNYRAHTMTGIVTENQTGDRFTVRAANGFTYRVLAVWGEPPTLNVGDRVRAYGDWKDGMLYASNTRVLRQG